MATFENDKQAKQRLLDPTPLTQEELRALTTLGEWTFTTAFTERVQIELALHQITAIDRFNKASGTYKMEHLC